MQEEPTQFINSMKSKYLSSVELEQSELDTLIQQRTQAKIEKNYLFADEIRKNLDEKGIILNDTKERTTWDLKELYSLSTDEQQTI